MTGSSPGATRRCGNRVLVSRSGRSSSLGWLKGAACHARVSAVALVLIPVALLFALWLYGFWSAQCMVDYAPLLK